MPTATPTKAVDLKRHVQRSKTVTVLDKDDTEWRFKIKPVSMLLWDETQSWMKLMRENRDKFLEQIKETVSAPSEIVLRRVITSSVEEPKITTDDQPDAVNILDLMRHDVLVINLYSEIAELSFSGLLKTEGQDARSPSSSSS